MGFSTHILDTALGRPAVQIGLTLSRRTEQGWEEIGTGITDTDGRCRTLLGEHAFEAAIYRIRFDTASYFAQQAVEGLYPFVEIVFTVREPEEHYHIPLLLTPNGYTTYRGS